MICPACDMELEKVIITRELELWKDGGQFVLDARGEVLKNVRCPECGHELDDIPRSSLSYMTRSAANAKLKED